MSHCLQFSSRSRCILMYPNVRRIPPTLANPRRWFDVEMLLPVEGRHFEVHTLNVLSSVHLRTTYPTTLAPETPLLRWFNVEILIHVGKKFFYVESVKKISASTLEIVPYIVKTGSTLDCIFAMNELKIHKINFISQIYSLSLSTLEI